MKCNKCQNEASFFYSETVNGQKASLALCADCAKAAGFFTGATAKSLEDDLYSVLFQKKQSPPSKSCPTCGTTWQSISGNGMVGCADCYKAFREALSASIRRMHGNTKHVGRAPAGIREKQEKETHVAALRAALQAAIVAENFEEAARLRDEIRALGDA